MNAKPLPPLAELQKYFSYNKNTGVLTWTKAKSRRVKPGMVAGHADTRGHLQVAFSGKFYMVHRIVWFIVTGSDPGEAEIDHENRIRGDNRWTNLRLSPQTGNQHNASKRSDNTSGHKGVTWHKNQRRWFGRVMHEKVTYRTGYFDNVESAAEAVRVLREALHKKFHHHG